MTLLRIRPVSLARLVEERLDDLVFGHGLDDLAANKDLALAVAVAGGNTEVSFACLTWAVDDATHHGDAQRYREAVEGRGDLLGEGIDVDLGSPARGAGDDL
jgi:hypothetical protein